MKKIILIALSSLVILFVIGCNGLNTEDLTTEATNNTTDVVTTEAPTTGGSTTEEPTTTTDTDPVISGAEDITIEKNSNFVPLEGITAWDEEDGDITSLITYNGNVNPMAEGEYTATYTVVDNDGNVTTKSITVTVVFVDSQGPLLVGVGAKTIYVGDQFNPLDGVSATDTVDGNVPVTFTGDLNIWVPGDYELEYTAEDASENVTTKTRTITVSFGDFGFGTPFEYTLSDFSELDNELSSPAITGGVINSTIADFTYVEVNLTVTSDAAGSIEIALDEEDGSASELDLLAGENEFTVFYRINNALTDSVFTINPIGTSISALDFSISFAEVNDTVAPTLNIAKDEIAYVVNYPQEGLEALLLEGVSAVDEIDGNITSQIVIDYGDLDLTTPGEYVVTYSVSDEGGNESEETIQVIIGNLVDSGFISDPNFENQGDSQWNEKESDGGDVDITYDDTEGVMQVKVNNVGIYTSAAGAYLKESSLTLEVDQWYMFTMTVKTDIDRSMGIRMGLATDQANGWFDDFNSKGEVRLDINGEYQTFNFYFKLDSLSSTAGWNEYLIELNLGSLNYSSIGTNGTTTFKDVAIYRVITAYEPPTYEENVGPNLPTKFTVGDAENTWSDYVTFYDMAKTVLTPTVDATDVDMDTPGTYEIILTATDERDESTQYTLEIQVLAVENADTDAPVVTLKDGVVTSVDQFTSLLEPLVDMVEATDAVDGTIEILSSMIDDGGLDLDVAGDYTITVSVYDLSGNVTNHEFVMTVIDKESPNINMNDFSINVNDTFDILNILEVNDNVDGIIPNENVTITGLDAFITDGVVVTEGTFTVTFEVSDAAGNLVTKSITVEVLDLEWDESTRTDLLNNHAEGPTHSTLTYDDVNDEYVITAIDVDVDPWDHARLVYYFDQLETGKIYKFEFTVKADTATDLHFRVGSTLSGDPWLDNYTGGVRTVSITDQYVTYQVVFEVDRDMPLGTAKFEFSYGYLSTDASNTIYINQFDIIQIQEDIQYDYEMVADLLGNQDEGPSHSTLTYDDVNDEYVITAIDVNVDPWDHARWAYYLDQLEDGETYRFVLSAKADQATDIYFRVGANLYVDPWIDNFEGGVQTINIGTEYVEYEVIFTVDKAMPNGNAKFQFMYGYLASDASNTIYINKLTLEKVVIPQEVVYTEVSDLLGIQDEGPTHSTLTYDDVNDEYVITAIDVNVDPWDHARWVYYLNQLEDGETYRFVLSAKADQATDIYFRVGANLYVDPWIDNFEGGVQTINIGTEYVEYEVIFTVDKAMPNGNAKFQFMYGYLASDATNTIYINKLTLEKASAAEEVTYTEVMDLLGNQDEGPSHSDVNLNVDNVYEITNIDPNTQPWDHARWVYYFDQLEAGETYRLIITTKATADTDLYFRVGSTLMADPWIDNFTGGLETVSISTYYETHEIIFTVDKDMPLGSAKFQFMYGYLASDADITILIKDFKLEKQQAVPTEVEVIVFNDFEDYADDTAYQAVTDDNIDGNRVSTGTFVKSNSTLVVDTDNNYLSQPTAAGNNGIKIKISQADVPDNMQYIGIWVKASDATGMISFKSFIYTASGYSEITSSLISDISELEAGTMVYIPVSVLETDTILLSLVIYTDSSVVSGAELYFDNIVLTSDIIPVTEPVNNAPVVSISDADLAVLASMTLEAANSLDSVITTLLTMIQIDDVEDGSITATEAMINFNGLDKLNPVMGSYTLEIIASDSESLSSNTYQLELSIVSILQDFNDFADDAALKAWDGLYGFRTSGGSWLEESGSLVIDPAGNTAAVTLGSGTNGIRINVTKAELEAMGAEYVGVYMKLDGSVSASSLFQSFAYDSGFQQITSYGDIEFINGGTFVFVKVSELKTTTTSVSIMVNAGSGSTGTLTIEKVVIK